VDNRTRLNCMHGLFARELVVWPSQMQCPLNPITITIAKDSCELIAYDTRRMYIVNANLPFAACQLAILLVVGACSRQVMYTVRLDGVQADTSKATGNLLFSYDVRRS